MLLASSPTKRGPDVADPPPHASAVRTLVVAGDDDHGRLSEVVALVSDRIPCADRSRISTEAWVRLGEPALVDIDDLAPDFSETRDLVAVGNDDEDLACW